MATERTAGDPQFILPNAPHLAPLKSIGQSQPQNLLSMSEWLPKKFKWPKRMLPPACEEVGMCASPKGCLLRCYKCLMILPVTYKITHMPVCGCRKDPRFKTDAEYVAIYMSNTHNKYYGLTGQCTFPKQALWALQWALHALAAKFDAKIRQARLGETEDGEGVGFRWPANVPEPSFSYTAFLDVSEGNDFPRIAINDILHTLMTYSAVPRGPAPKRKTARHALPTAKVPRASPLPRPRKTAHAALMGPERLPASFSNLPDDPVERARVSRGCAGHGGMRIMSAEQGSGKEVPERGDVSVASHRRSFRKTF